MLEFFINGLLWFIIGAITGFYAAYIKRYNPWSGVVAGGVVGLVIGFGGLETGLINTVIVALFTTTAVVIIGGLLVPWGDYDQTVTASTRINNLAYALMIPTLLIVFSIVVFPVIWNLVFSFRDIEVGDLRTVDLADFSDLTLENYVDQLALRIDQPPCVIEEGSDECVVDASGNIEYENLRRTLGQEYRGYDDAFAVEVAGERYVVSGRNPEFYETIVRTIGYTLASTIMAILFGLVAALVVREEFFGRSVFRGFILFPYIAPVISVAFIWQVLLRSRGLVNETLGTSTPFLSQGAGEVAGIAVPLIMLILFQTWRYFPFAFLFLLARIQAIPEDMYEAAKVDGATPSQRLWYITLPQLRPVFGTLFLLRFIWTFNKFDDVFLLTGVNSDTRVITVDIYDSLFIINDVGRASAIAVIMAVILAVVLAIYFRFFLAEES